MQEYNCFFGAFFASGQQHKNKFYSASVTILPHHHYHNEDATSGMPIRLDCGEAQHTPRPV